MQFIRVPSHIGKLGEYTSIQKALADLERIVIKTQKTKRQKSLLLILFGHGSAIATKNKLQIKRECLAEYDYKAFYGFIPKNTLVLICYSKYGSLNMLVQ